MIGFKQSVKVFSTKFSLPTDPRKFSPLKVYCYTVILSAHVSNLQNAVHMIISTTSISAVYDYDLCSIMSLKALDGHVISDEEIIENLHLEDPFKPLSERFRLPLYQSYPVVSYYIEYKQPKSY